MTFCQCSLYEIYAAATLFEIVLYLEKVPEFFDYLISSGIDSRIQKPFACVYFICVLYMLISM